MDGSRTVRTPGVIMSAALVFGIIFIVNIRHRVSGLC